MCWIKALQTKAWRGPVNEVQATAFQGFSPWPFQLKAKPLTCGLMAHFMLGYSAYWQQRESVATTAKSGLQASASDRQSVTPWINYLLKEECNTMLFSKKITLFLLYFCGTLSPIHWLLICGSWQTQPRHLLPQGLPSSFKHQQLLTQETSITQAGNARKLPLERRCDWSFKNKWMGSKSGKRRGISCSKRHSDTKCSQISSVITLHQASVHAAECSKILLPSVTLEKYLQRVRVVYTVPDMFFSSPCWTYNKPPSFTETESFFLDSALVLTEIKTLQVLLKHLRANMEKMCALSERPWFSLGRSCWPCSRVSITDIMIILPE